MKFLVTTGVICLFAGCAATPGAGTDEAAPALAMAASAQADGPESAPAATAGEERVCRRMDVIGSIRPKRVCASAAEWAAKEQQDLENMEDYERDRRRAEGVRTLE